MTQTGLLSGYFLEWQRQNRSLQWHHNERDGVSNHQHHDGLLNRLFRRSSKKTSTLRVTGLCARNSPVNGEFPAQTASNSENVFIWWRHHGPFFFDRYCVCRNRKRWESSGGIGVAPRYHRPTEVERRRRKYFGNRSRETHWKLCSCHDQLFQTYLVTGREIHLLNSLWRILCFIELNVNLNESWQKYMFILK